MDSRIARFRQTVAVALAMTALLAFPVEALACKGLTWVWRSHTGAVDNVGVDNFSNPYQGDTSCSSALPLLCLRKSGLPPPSYINPSFTNGWTGGSIQLTSPRFGYELTSRAAADALCANSFGPGWALGEFHDGDGGWGWYAYGAVNTTGRFWVAIDDQPANPWDFLPAGTGRIEGWVTDNSSFRRAIPGVVVTAGGYTSAPTDSQGHYVLQNLPVGTYTLRASRSDWTFGSTPFQNDHYTTTLSAAGAQVFMNITGWNFEPVLFVHGWTSNLGDFRRVRPEFQQRGYYTGLDTNLLETDILYTPPFEVNARHVRDWIDDAKYVTGRDKVVLYAQSMGGLVARTYLESSMYRGDVSQLFTYGSPHLGISSLLSTGCYLAPRPDAICQMTGPGMTLFNLTHFKRGGVDYHLTAGDAPMWKLFQVCFRIFGRKVCLVSVPVPDLSFRSWKGWAMGALIPGGDDGFIQTCSASGMPGSNIDRYLTQEVHFSSTLGSRDYHEWDGAPSAQGYAQCSRRVLIDRTTVTCGARSALPPPACFVGFLRRHEGKGEFEPNPSAPGLEQNSRIEQAVLRAGEHRVRSLFVEGGATTFSAVWGEGSVGFKLIDPTGQVIDPEYAASIQADSDTSDAEIVEEPSPDMVVYSQSATQASYYLPAARSGVWQLVLDGGDLPKAGTSFTTAAQFNSGLHAEFSHDRQFYEPGRTAELRVSLSEGVLSAQAVVRVLRAEGVEEKPVSLKRISETEFVAAYALPASPGYLGLDWSVTGQRSDGVVFERGGREFIQVQSSSLRVKDGSFTDRALARPEAEGLHSALVVSLVVSSDYAKGDLGVFAELTDTKGQLISRTNTTVAAQQGGNRVQLRFSAEDLYRAGRDGPYLVRNVRLLDERNAPLLSQELETAHTTAAYAYRSFAPTRDTPSVYLDGPFSVSAGGSVTLSASGVDPEGDVLAYAWDLDEDGHFEVSGRSVMFSAERNAVGLRTVRVWVSDPQGHSAVAETRLEILAPR